MWSQRKDPPNIGKEESTEALLSSEESSLTESQFQSRKPPRSRNIILLVITHCLLAIAGLLLGWYWRFDSSAVAARITARYSPFIKDVGLKYNTVQYNGSFFKETSFRKDAGPEVDAAWESLGVNYRALRVPVEDAARSGLAADQVQINSKYGGGYPANVEGLHHLHCLNLLRQSLYYNFDYYHALGNGAFKNDDNILKSHVTHCLDILRQQLMCSVDVGMLGQVWWDPPSPRAFVDFNTKHTCRNFEDIRKWAEAKQLPEKPPPDFLQPPRPGQYIAPEIP